MIYDYLVDTDVFIWYLRGNEKAKELLHSIDFCISSITYMELIQGMRNKHELKLLQKMIKSWEIKVIYIDEDISAKALFYMEEYFLSHTMELADSLIGATCTKYGLTLITANDKHYKVIRNLDIKVFRP
ncbi:MAG: type II toxin-antitoxin system VapC family toxin [Epsilonproteobacteria bacterium]|nr:type II toxin-antitoxin system VapC family toxin [Campylobacterota bacterium]